VQKWEVYLGKIGTDDESTTEEEELVEKPGEYLLDYGRCVYCGGIEPTEGENHPYFYEGKFVSKACYVKMRGTQINVESQRPSIRLLFFHI